MPIYMYILYVFIYIYIDRRGLINMLDMKGFLEHLACEHEGYEHLGLINKQNAWMIWDVSEFVCFC